MKDEDLAAEMRKRIDAVRSYTRAKNIHPSEPAWHRAFGRLSAYNEVLELVTAADSPAVRALEDK